MEKTNTKKPSTKLMNKLYKWYREPITRIESAKYVVYSLAVEAVNKGITQHREVSKYIRNNLERMYKEMDKKLKDRENTSQDDENGKDEF